MATQKNTASKKASKKSEKRKKAERALTKGGSSTKHVPVTHGGFLAHLHDEIGKLFHRYGGQSEDGGTWPQLTPQPYNLGFSLEGVMPRVDVGETDKAYEVTVEIPGCDTDDFDVSVTGQVLTIKGEKSHEREREEKDYHVRERSYGAFHRSLAIPEWVDTEKVSASYSKGVLTVSMPKTPQAKKNKRTIVVKEAS